MTAEIASIVYRKTLLLDDGYLAYASHQSMSFYLADWVKARDRLDRQIERLRSARDAREADAKAGRWPPTEGDDQ